MSICSHFGSFFNFVLLANCMQTRSPRKRVNEIETWPKKKKRIRNRSKRVKGWGLRQNKGRVFCQINFFALCNCNLRRLLIDFSVKLSTIRIWMHEKDIGKLTRILWAGQGQRLCQQASNNSRVKRFLAAVPHVMVSSPSNERTTGTCPKGFLEHVVECQQGSTSGRD